MFHVLIHSGDKKKKIILQNAKWTGVHERLKGMLCGRIERLENSMHT